MANFCGLGRTNYFRVTEQEAFDKLIEETGVEVLHQRDGVVALSGYDSDDGGLPDEYEDEDGNDRDFFAALMDCVHPDDVVIYMSAGNEKSRYVAGYAVGMKRGQEDIIISLEHIYDLAAGQFGVPRQEISRAEY